MTPADVLREHDWLANVLARRCAPPGVREDAIQVARLAMVEALVSWDPSRGSFVVWARWRMRDALRAFAKSEIFSGMRGVRRGWRASADSSEAQPDETPRIDEVLEDKQAREALREALTKLPPGDVAALLCTGSRRRRRALEALASRLGVAAPPRGHSRVSAKITWRGQTRTAAEWSRVLGIPRRSFNARRAQGWDLDRIAAACTTHGK